MDPKFLGQILIEPRRFGGALNVLIIVQTEPPLDSLNSRLILL